MGARVMAIVSTNNSTWTVSMVLAQTTYAVERRGTVVERVLGRPHGLRIGEAADRDGQYSSTTRSASSRNL